MSTCSRRIAVLSLHHSIWFHRHGQSIQKTNFWIQSFNHLSPPICTPNQNLHSNAENGFVPLFLREWEVFLSSFINTQVDSGLIFAFSLLANPALTVYLISNCHAFGAVSIITTCPARNELGGTMILEYNTITIYYEILAMQIQSWIWTTFEILNTSTIRSHEIEKLRNFKEVFLIYYKKTDMSVTDKVQRAVYYIHQKLNSINVYCQHRNRGLNFWAQCLSIAMQNSYYKWPFQVTAKCFWFVFRLS